MFILAGTCDSLKDVIAIVGFILNVIQWVVPVILIVIGSIDLVKAVIASKEDDIKKGQQTLIKRLIAAVIVFLVPLIVSVVMSLIGQNGGTDSWSSCWNEYHDAGISDLFNLEV